MKTPDYSFVEVDVETLSTEYGASILQIGAVFVPADTEISVPEGMYDETRIPSFMRYVKGPGWVDPGTVQWHHDTGTGLVEQSVNVGIPLRKALLELTGFVETYAPHTYCANAPLFDFGLVLDPAYEKANLTSPFKFYNQMCTRTLRVLGYRMDLASTLRRIDVFTPAHDALADARCQAWDHIQVLNNLP